MDADGVRLISTTIHGRILVRQPADGSSGGLLVGFHGYMENASIQMERLAAIRGANRWTLMSVQGLHRFYRGRSEDVVASWMTREDRDTMIADNMSYVDRAVETVPVAARRSIVYAGFSQGVAMAFRAAVLGRSGSAGVIAVGGDVPPELLADSGVRFPPVLLVRGERDEWFTETKFSADAAALSARAVGLETAVVDAAHEWNAEVAERACAFLGSLGIEG